MANEQKREIRRVAGALAAGMSRLGLSEVEDPRCASQMEQPLVRLLVVVLLGLASGQRSLRELGPVGLPFGVVAIDGKHTVTRLASGEYAQTRATSRRSSRDSTKRTGASS